VSTNGNKTLHLHELMWIIEQESGFRVSRSVGAIVRQCALAASLHAGRKTR